MPRVLHHLAKSPARNSWALSDWRVLITDHGPPPPTSKPADADRAAAESAIAAMAAAALLPSLAWVGTTKHHPVRSQVAPKAQTDASQPITNGPVQSMNMSSKGVSLSSRSVGLAGGRIAFATRQTRHWRATAAAASRELGPSLIPGPWPASSNIGMTCPPGCPRRM